MSFSSLLVFIGVYLAAVATPGPGVAALVARVLGQGLAGIAPFIAGFLVGDLIWFSVAATGLAVLAHEFAGVFTAIRLAGVAYLLYLAWTMWRAPARPADVGPVQSASGARSFLGALSLTLGNPKVIVFFLSIMPLVVDLDAINAKTAITLAATMMGVLSSVLLTYALAANRARKLFRSSRAMKMINRGAAGVMAGAALAIAAR
ncbi:LysE family translocator [Methylocapsa sp. S129]|uniref:LysE family translocator n=1 Tax=Methylocapsa sp. S129 TaxID=1641869 RepID=UPI00131D4868|nr:LysE family translocator [Methylocapsa sp. S129]